MPTWLAIVLIVLVVLVALAFIGGVVVNRRRLEETEHDFDRHLDEVNRDLAIAHAADRGWERAGLQSAAEAAVAAQRPGVVPSDLTLVQIVDRPGTDEDKAIFRFEADGRAERLTLGRHDGHWAFESLG